MGLDLSHGAGHWTYGGFNRWRRRLAVFAGIPDLDDMEGHEDIVTGQGARIPWESLPPDPLHALLHHSDCDGDIGPDVLPALCDRMEELLRCELSDEDKEGIRLFINGAREAASKGESLEFF